MTRQTPLAALVPALMAALAGASVAGAARADDTGDAPEGYGPATHAVVPGAPFLGREAPDDNAPAASLSADGDDVAEGDDEDGVFAFPALVQNGKAYSVNAFASNPSGRAATLRAWVDFDGDGAFQADESATATVPAGASNEKFKLRWNDLAGVTTDFTGETYARFRITTDGLAAGDAAGAKADGEVEDYLLSVEPDTDGDEVPDALDADNDNDGIPDTVEVVGVDTDGDGTPDYLDPDSDGDGVADFAEAGADPARPVDSDGDGAPDYLDTDSDGDGTPDGAAAADDLDGDGASASVEGEGDADGDGVANDGDLDADNDSIPDAVELGDGDAPVDTDGDGVPDFLDLDSDNDGLADLVEGGGAALVAADVDADGDGRIDDGLPVGANGLLDAFETEPDSGRPSFATVDTDGDGARDYVDLDADGDSVNDVAEAGLADDEADGLVEGYADTDGDGVADALDDADADGFADGAGSRAPAALPDTDADGTPDVRDPDADGSSGGEGAGGGQTGGGDAGTGGAGVGTAGGETAGDAGDTGGADDGTAGTTAGDTDGTDGGEATAGGLPDTGTGGLAPGGTTDGGADGAAVDGDGPVEDDPDDGEVRTGLDGGAGCSIASAPAGPDPLFALLLGAAGAWLARRRRPGEGERARG